MIPSRFPLLSSLFGVCLAAFALPVSAENQPHHLDARKGVPVTFSLDQPATVTLVVDTPEGRRVRNLVNAERFEAGEHTVFWDGLTEGLRRYGQVHGIYDIAPELASPGEYVVRGVRSPGIEPRFEFTVYPNTGNPPWISSESSGGWLADHTPPSAVLYIPADEAPGGTAQILIASRVAESGDGLVWTDLEGKKLAGTRTVGGHWTGASHLARNLGPNAPENVYAFTGMGWNTDSDRDVAELRIMALSNDKTGTSLSGRSGDVGRNFYQVLRLPITDGEISAPRPGARTRTRVSLRGFTAYNGVLLALVNESDELFVIRVQGDKGRNKDGGTVIGKIPAPNIHDVAFAHDGTLVALEGDGITRYRFSINGSKPQLSNRQVVVASGLDEPVRISVAEDGNLFVSQHGNSHNVVVFSASGERLGVAGAPWRAEAGPYDEKRMNSPAGTTTTSEGVLWVAEHSFAPKRVSVWNPDGSLKASFIGPSQYGGGGFLDPKNRERLYYSEQSAVLEFKLDWENGSAELGTVPFLQEPDTEPFFLSARVEPPEAVFYRGDEQYFTNAFTGRPAAAPNFVTVWRKNEREVLEPLAFAGRADQWHLLLREEIYDFLPEFVRQVRADRASGESVSEVLPVFVAWSDTNANGIPELDEITFLPLESGEAINSAVIDEQLRFWVLTSQRRVLRLDPEFDADSGRPRYDAAATIGIDVAEYARGTYTDVVPTADDGFILAGGPIWGFDSKGQPEWSYHSRWVGVHASHRSPRTPEFPGQLLGTTRVMGWPQPAPTPGIGKIWSINSNYAVMYLFTTDGLYLGTVGGFPPDAPQWRMPTLERNESLAEVNFIGEHFYPTFTRTSDGNYYFVAGKNHTSIVRLDGIKEIAEMPRQTIRLSPEQFVAAERVLTKAQDGGEDATEKVFALPVSRLGKKPTATASDWADADWMTVESRRIRIGGGQGDFHPWSEATAEIRGDRLHVAVRTYDRDLLENTAENSALLFKSGGAIDLQIGVDVASPRNRREPVRGDVRLIVGESKGKPVVTLYEPESPEGKQANQSESFSSPWRTITFDRVVDVSESVQLAKTSENIKIENERGNASTTLRRETHEFSVPLQLLGITAQPGSVLLADIGVLIGDSGETVQRHYWSNTGGGLVSDIPGEAQLSPASWGEWKLTPANR